MLSHIWGQTHQPTNRPVTDQLLELLEWVFATKKAGFSAFLLLTTVHQFNSLLCYGCWTLLTIQHLVLMHNAPIIELGFAPLTI